MSDRLPPSLSDMERLPVMPSETRLAAETHGLQSTARVLLGSTLIGAGIGHLTFARRDFRAQVPDWVPLDVDTTVLASGVVEIALGSALIFARKEHRATVGTVAAGFFAAVFPGNVSQYVHGRSAFGLDTDRKRLARLFFQPVLVAWALLSTRDDRAEGA